MKYPRIPLTFHAGLRVSIAVALLGISRKIFVTQDDPSVTQRLWSYDLYPQREPAQPPSSRRQFNFLSDTFALDLRNSYRDQLRLPQSLLFLYQAYHRYARVICSETVGWVDDHVYNTTPILMKSTRSSLSLSSPDSLAASWRS